MIPDFTTSSLSDLFSLQGRNAVVTGGAQGIGSQTVRRLSELGARVIVADIDDVSAEATALAIDATHPLGTSGNVLSAHVDVTDTTAVAAVADLCCSMWGSLDIWINNAGIFPTTGPAIDADDAFFQHLLAVNVGGTFAGAREAARRMERGVIVNVASTTSFRAAPGISAYVTSKHAVLGLTRSLALEFGPRDIRVVGVAPGPIDTPGVQDQLAPLKAAGLDVSAHMSRTPLGRAGQPDDIARVIAFLTTDMAAWINGDVIVIDAGSHAG